MKGLTQKENNCHLDQQNNPNHQHIQKKNPMTIYNEMTNKTNKNGTLLTKPRNSDKKKLTNKSSIKFFLLQISDITANLSVLFYALMVNALHQLNLITSEFGLEFL